MSGATRERSARAELIDYADGVPGHYCIGRKRDGYSEFWNPFGMWSATGFLFTHKELAASIAKLLNEQAATEEVQELRDALEQFGQHADNCRLNRSKRRQGLIGLPIEGPCDCGLGELLAKYTKA